MKIIIHFLCIGLLSPLLVQGAAKFSDCGGEDKSIIIKDGFVKPDPVEYPGNLSMTVSLVLKKDLPDIQMEIQLTKSDLGDVLLPCLNGFGSCSYDVCEMIENYRSLFCPMFPNPEECGCPIKAGSYSVKDASAVIPNLDVPEEIAEILLGTYNAILTLTDSKGELGCIATSFEMVASK